MGNKRSKRLAKEMMSTHPKSQQRELTGQTERKRRRRNAKNDGAASRPV